MPESKLAVGVDIGGTKVAAGVVDAHGKILCKTRVPMKTNGTASQAMDCVHAAVRTILSTEAGRRASAIGVASPGPLALPAGIVLHTPNVPCWRDFPLGDSIRSTYRLLTLVDNDANAAGLAEALWGAGSAYSSVFYATIGTGIGTAFVLDRRIFYGRTGTAPEGGHMTIDFRAPCLCGCGKRGCLEGFVSGPAIARRARAKFPAGESVLAGLCAGDPARITTEMLGNAWHAGDATAAEVLKETAELLAIWFGNIIDLLEPDVIVVGGGVGKLVAEWFEPISAQLPRWSINSRCQEIAFQQAKYGSDAGIAGAAALCFSAPAQIRAAVTSPMRAQAADAG